MDRIKVLFADLDGTLIETYSGATFPKGLWDMRFKFDVLDKVKELKPELLIIVTNQGGIEKGYMKEKDFVKGKMAFVTRAVEDYTGVRCVFQHCIYNDPKCIYRKPNTGMLEVACRKNLPQEGVIAYKEEMMMIGDASGKPGDFSDSDRKCAETFGIVYMDVNDFLLV